ncbi:MAG: lipopolysaccharide kinase InaA family protein [Pseudomonadota bacterium]
MTPLEYRIEAGFEPLLKWVLEGSEAGADFTVRLVRDAGDGAGNTEGNDAGGDSGDVDTLRCARVLRWLPGRRVVCSGRFGERAVVAKWFFGGRARRHAAREAQGALALAAGAVRTPQLIEQATVTAPDGASAQLLLFAEVPAAQPLTDATLSARPELWDACLELLAGLYRAGLEHRDLHFGNLLVRDGELWLIDGDRVRGRRSPLSNRRAIAQFARLCAEREAVLDDAVVGESWAGFRQHSAWRGAAQLGRVRRAYARARLERLRRFAAKTQRRCTAFARLRVGGGELLADRDWLRGVGAGDSASRDELLQWLFHLIDRLEEQAPLKLGNTATVARAQWRDQSLVVKRYNNKSLWHRLRRALRPNRGLISWTAGHSLRFVGIATPRPVALLRTRFAGPTLLVTQWQPGEALGPAALESQAGALGWVAAALDRLHAEGFEHRDMKATNLLVDTAAERVVLIDLDALRLHSGVAARTTGARRDRQRLLRNFAESPEVQRDLRSRLGL